MRRTSMIVVAAGAALVGVLAWIVGSGRVPLGVPGDWEWQRVRVRPAVGSIVMALVGLIAYSLFVARGIKAMSGPVSRVREGFWLIGLVAGSVGVQAIVQEGAPEGFGLSKWIIALHAPGSSGYYTVARQQMKDPGRFLADYPDWIARQDALHVGTHPPGLFLVAKGMLSAMEAHPSMARAVTDWSPPSVSMAIQAFRESLRLPRADGAALALTGALTLLACASTVVPLYFLARSSLDLRGSWFAASLWPVVPSSMMFQPTADTAFPLLATTALALACWAHRRAGAGGLAMAAGAGLVLALGMEFTLAFLPTGLIVALIFGASPGPSWVRRLILVFSTGLGFLAATMIWWGMTSANPFLIWWWNQRNHARFYEEYPRKYWAWTLINPIELAVGLGLPSSVWVMVGLSGVRKVPRAVWATIGVLVFLTLSGKNLSEVARLWLPMMPALLVGAGVGWDRLKAGPWSAGISTFLVGVEVLILESMIQVVYPI